MTIAKNGDIQRRLAINAKRIELRCEASVGTFRWLARTKNRKCYIFPKSNTTLLLPYMYINDWIPLFLSLAPEIKLVLNLPIGVHILQLKLLIFIFHVRVYHWR